MNLSDIVMLETPGTLRPFEHPRWGAAFAEPDPAGITLDMLTKALAEASAARIAMWSAIDDLGELAWRDSRDMVVTHRGGVIEDAWIVTSWRSESPQAYVLDLAVVDPNGWWSEATQ